MRREEWSDNRNENIHKHSLGEIKFTNGIAEKILGNKKDDWNIITDYNKSLPQNFKNVLFKTSRGEIYYGFMSIGYKPNWYISLNNEAYHIKDVIAWKELDLNE